MKPQKKAIGQVGHTDGVKLRPSETINQPAGDQKGFENNQEFRKTYKQLFKEDPVSANLLLLLAELADQDGNIIFAKEDGASEEQLTTLMQIRFSDPFSWQLGGKG